VQPGRHLPRVVSRGLQALRALTGPELDQMETAFEAFERRLRGEAAGDRLRALAEHLTSLFAPDPERMAAAAAMPHCGPLDP
jgi:hypothetical protein